MKLNQQYLDFFCKSNYVKMPYKLSDEKSIIESISNTIVANANLSKKSLCMFNSSSLLNTIRLNECNHAYINESEKTSKPSIALDDSLKRMYLSKVNKSRLIASNINKCYMFDAFDKDPNSDVYGNILVTCLVDINICKPIDLIKSLSIKADMLGYSYVDYEIENETTIIDNNEKFICCWLKIQFEALYISPNLKYGDKLYHVTTKNIANKIMSKKIGLTPRNNNSYEFSYSPRIYCFIDKSRELQKQYATVSGKQNKKFLTLDNYDSIANFAILQAKKTGILVDTKEFSILEIDTTKLNNVKFYRDNTFEIDGNFVAVYTSQNIPFYALTEIETFTIGE